MRHFARRHRFVCLPLIASMPLLMSACDRLKPAGEADTMSLLRSGSEKVCIASDVQKTLRELIVPAPSSSSAGEDAASKIAAAAAVNVSFDLTTLQSVDKQVAKAVCNTTAAIGSANSKRTTKFQIDYTISPSAESANAFVVTANNGEASAFAQILVALELAEIATKAEKEQQDRDARQVKAQVLATVNERWLQGAWIDAGESSEACGNGNALWFQSRHAFEGPLGSGRWTLSSDQIHLVGGTGQAVDLTGSITAADAVSFQVDWQDTDDMSLRRCTRAEIETLPQPTQDEATDDAESSDI